MKITTTYWRKPIPTNKFDWSAWDDDTYDIGQPTGYGPTEEAAIADLKEQMEERNERMRIGHYERSANT